MSDLAKSSRTKSESELSDPSRMENQEADVTVTVSDDVEDGRTSAPHAEEPQYDDDDDDDPDDDDDDDDEDMSVKGMQHSAAAAAAAGNTSRQTTSLLSQQVPSIPKSYVSVLNEIASHRREPLTYELLKAEGFSHQPMFVYKVRMGQCSVTGEGRRKKEARQDAARNLLVRIGTTFENEEEETAALASKSLSILDDARRRGWTPGDGDAPASTLQEVLAGSLSLVDGVGGPNKTGLPFAGATTPIPPCKMHNPVGSVQEMTMFMRWPPPQFKIERQSGPPHDAVFTMACFVWDKKTIGTGKSKKEAKRLSALSMYNYLRYNPNVIHEWRLREGLARSSMNRPQDIKKVRSNEANARRMQHVEMSEHRDKPSMQRLVKITDVFNLSSYDQYNISPLDLLQMLANDYQFNIAFEDAQVDAVLPPVPEVGDPLWTHLLGLHEETHHVGKAKNLEERNGTEKRGEVEGIAKSGVLEPPAAPPTRRVWCSTIRLSTKNEIHEFGTGLTKQAARERACLAVLQYIKLHTYEKFTEFADLTLTNYLKMPWKDVEAHHDRIKNRHFDGDERESKLNSCRCDAPAKTNAGEAPASCVTQKPQTEGKSFSLDAKKSLFTEPLCFDLVPTNRGACEAWSIEELERYLEQDPFIDASIERFLDLEKAPFFDEDLM